MPDTLYVTIHDQNWKIVFVDVLQQDGEECDGLTCRDSKTITLRNGQNREDLLDTILHEAVHVSEGGTTILAESWIRELTGAQVKLLGTLGFLALNEGT
jgi:hypothetical protein